MTKRAPGLKETIKRIPVVGSLATAIWRRLHSAERPFTTSEEYWIRRYASGGNSGSGSYNRLAEFKARVLNEFVRQEGIGSVIEFGCGDGNQLRLAEYPSYLGFDVSPRAVAACREIFATDATKAFKLVGEYAGETADATFSLDVVYHLVEDGAYHEYMARLFDAARRFVVVYSSDTDEQQVPQAPHVRHRRFSAWVKEQRPEWRLRAHLPNEFPYRGDAEEGSLADFYIFEKA